MLEIEQKEDSAEKLAAVAGKPTKNFLFAEEVNQIVQEVNNLEATINPDRLISLGTETIDENEYTYEGYTWQLNGIQINNIGNPSIIVIPSATIGYKRNDISVFKADGTIERIAGTETNGEVVTTPDVPEGTLFYKSYSVNGIDIDAEPEPPAFDGSIYKKKIENIRWKSNQSGSEVIIDFRPEGYFNYSVINSGLISVAGFSTDLLTTAIAEGQDILFENQTGNAIGLKNMFAGISTPFNLGADLVVPNDGKIWFRYRNGKLELIMKSWGIDFPIDNETYAVKNGIPTKLTDDLYRSWFSYMANNGGSWIVLNTGNPLTVSGTSTVVPRSGVTIYGSIIMNNCVSSTSNGSNAGIKNNLASDGVYLEGVDAYFMWANNDSNNQCCTTVGLYSLISAIPNLDPSNFTAQTVIVGNDVGDTNLSFYVNRTGAPASFVKVPTNSSFPANSTTDAYLLRIQISKTLVDADRTAKLTLINIVTGAVITHSFVGSQLPTSSTNFLVVINRSNRNTGVATNTRPAKIYVNRKLF